MFSIFWQYLCNYIKQNSQNEKTNIIDLKVLAPLGTSDHSSIEFKIIEKVNRIEKQEIMLVNKVKWILFRKQVSVDWKQKLDLTTVEKSWKMFKQVVIQAQSEMKSYF